MLVSGLLGHVLIVLGNHTGETHIPTKIHLWPLVLNHTIYLALSKSLVPACGAGFGHEPYRHGSRSRVTGILDMPHDIWHLHGYPHAFSTAHIVFCLACHVAFGQCYLLENLLATLPELMCWLHRSLVTAWAGVQIHGRHILFFA